VPPPVSAEFTAVVCTRGRPQQLTRTLSALRACGEAFPILVVDQSAEPLAGDERVEVIHDGGSGLSRARNVGLRRAATEWVAYVDDDCIVAADWAARLREALLARPDAALIAGDVPDSDVPAAVRDYVPASAFRVERERVRRGRFVHPGLICFGVCFAVRRDVALALGGWDERLGPGARDFPAADDMDFNYRLLRAGKLAFQTPSVRASHEQWRRPEELPALYRGYLRAWSGFAMKHLRGDDVLGGAWLWSIGAVDALDMLVSALARRSRLRMRIALAKVRGLAEGTLMGITRRW